MSCTVQTVNKLPPQPPPPPPKICSDLKPEIVRKSLKNVIRIKGLRMFVTVLVLNCCFLLGFSKFLQQPKWPGQVSVVDSALLP